MSNEISFSYERIKWATRLAFRKRLYAMTRSFAIQILVDCGSSLPCPTGNPSSRRCGMWLIIKRVYVGILSDRYSEVEKRTEFLTFSACFIFCVCLAFSEKIIQRQGVLPSWSKHSENWVGSQMVQQFGQSQSTFPFRIRSSCNFINRPFSKMAAENSNTLE